MHSLRNGFYQGWDLHPAQFVTRYAAVYRFFLDGLDERLEPAEDFRRKGGAGFAARRRLRRRRDRTGIAQFFPARHRLRRDHGSEALATGLTLEEIRSRSFLKILAKPAEVNERRARVSIERQAGSRRLGFAEHDAARMVARQRTDRLEGRLRRGRLRRVLGRDRRSRCARETLLSLDQQLPRSAPAHGRARHRHGGRRRGAKRLHPVQQAMVENFGSQCGYCTPGFIMSLFEGYYRKDLKTAAQLDEQLCGNLCRCTGYRPIRDAAADAFAQRNGADAFDEQLKTAKAKIERRALRVRGARNSFARLRSRNCSPRWRENPERV